MRLQALGLLGGLAGGRGRWSAVVRPRVLVRLLAMGVVGPAAGLLFLLLLMNALQLPHDQRIYVPRLPSLLSEQWLGDCPRDRLGMLLAVTDWLDANDVPYFLGFGTLLGAVRQKVRIFTPSCCTCIYTPSTQVCVESVAFLTTNVARSRLSFPGMLTWI